MRDFFKSLFLRENQKNIFTIDIIQGDDTIILYRLEIIGYGRKDII